MHLSGHAYSFFFKYFLHRFAWIFKMTVKWQHSVINPMVNHRIFLLIKLLNLYQYKISFVISLQLQSMEWVRYKRSKSKSDWDEISNGYPQNKFTYFINKQLSVALAAKFPFITLVISVCHMKPKTLIACQMKCFCFFCN